MGGRVEGFIKGSLRSYINIVTGGFTALLFLSMVESAHSTVLSLIKNEFSLNYTLSGALTSSYFLGYALGQIPWGYIADRIGPTRTISLSTFGTALSLILFGLIGEIWQIIMLRFLSGLLGAGIFVSTVKLTSICFSPLVRGTVLGILNIGTNLGLAIASWFFPHLSLIFGWRHPLICFGMVGGIFAGVAKLSLGNRDLFHYTQVSNSLGEIFKSKNFWILASLNFIRLGVYNTFVAWLPVFLHEGCGLDLLTAGTTFTFFSLAGIISSPLGGFVSDHTNEKFTIFFSFISLALALYLVELEAFPILAIIILLGLFTNFMRSPMFTLISKLWGDALTGVIAGTHNTFAAIGAFTLPLCFGYLIDRLASYYFGWIFLLLLVTIGAHVSLFIKHSNIVNC